MKKKKYKAYIFLSILSLLGAFFSFVWIRPQKISLTEDFSYEADLSSYDNFYDAEQGSYEGAQESLSRFYFQAGAAENNLIHVTNSFNVATKTGKHIFGAKKSFNINPLTTQRITANNNADPAYLFAPPVNGKKDFIYRHINYNTPIVMKFVESGKINGLKIYRFSGHFSADQTSSLTHLEGVPEKYNIITEGDIDLWIEPVSGYLVKYTDSATAWYTTLDTNEYVYPWNSFSNTYKDLSFFYHIAEAKEVKKHFVMFNYLVPGIFIFFGFLSFLMFFMHYPGSIEKGFLGATKRKLFSRSIIIPFIVFLILSSIVVWLWSLIKDNIKEEAFQSFEAETNLISTAIDQRIHNYIGALEAGRGLFVSSDDVTRDEWKSFSESLELQEKYPGIQGFGYSEYIPTKEALGEHIAKIRSEGFPEYSVYPEGERENYSAIIYLEPFDERNQQAFGLDMFFEENRREAMTGARETGTPYMSGRVILVQEIDEDVQPGFLIYVPVYTNHRESIEKENRAEFLKGFVYSPFRMRDLMSGILSDRDLSVDFTVFDGSDYTNNDNIMYSSVRQGDNDITKSDFSDFVYIDTLRVAHRDWTIVFTPRVEFGVGLAKESSAQGVLVGGVFLSFLIALVTHLLFIGQAHAILLAKKMSYRFKKEAKEKESINAQLMDNIIELESAKEFLEFEEQKNEALISSIGDGLVVVDKNNLIQLVNVAFEQITGYAASDVIGKQFDTVLGAYDQNGKNISLENRPLWQALKEKKYTNNSYKELFYKNKAGVLFPIATSVSPVIIGDNTLGAVAIFRDVTEEFQIDKAKTEFVSLASHQLRTPLTALRWYLEMLYDTNTYNYSDEQKMYFDEIDRGSQRMVDLVNDLLNVSRIELGSFGVNPQDINPREILESLRKDFKPIMKDKDVECIIHDEHAPTSYLGDPSLLEMIFQNLLSNAIKYTEKGSITVTLSQDSEYFLISVADTGYGIPQSQQNKIFQKMFRAENVKSLDTTGTGLGLYIIKAVVEQVEGEISFESQEGVGTTFSIKLPIAGMKKKEGSKPLEV